MMKSFFISMIPYDHLNAYMASRQMVDLNLPISNQKGIFRHMQSHVLLAIPDIQP